MRVGGRLREGGGCSARKEGMHEKYKTGRQSGGACLDKAKKCFGATVFCALRLLSTSVVFFLDIIRRGLLITVFKLHI